MNSRGRYIRTAAMLCCAVVFTGCGSAANTTQPAGNFSLQKKINQPSFGKMPITESSHAAEVPDKIRDSKIGNQVAVYKIKLPQGAFSGNEKIWRMVDEDSLDSQTSLMLAQNGIRAATLAQSHWPTIAKMLQGYSAFTEQFICRTDSGIAVELMMRPGIEQQSLFYIDRDLNLQGRTFERCDNKFRLIVSHPSGSKNFLITIEPIVLAGTIQVVRAPGDLTPTRDQIRREQTFENLRLWADIKPDQALILTPTQMKESPFSVGSRFLAEIDGAPPSETILVFVPQK